jgi:2,3,4,5-tetrahydropyridine-2-carboxylate N-succinyltransferase
MSNNQLEEAIETAWNDRDNISPDTVGQTRTAIEETLNALDAGSLRVAERQPTGEWRVNQWVKKEQIGGIKLIVNLKVGEKMNGNKLILELFLIV